MRFFHSQLNRIICVLTAVVFSLQSIGIAPALAQQGLLLPPVGVMVTPSAGFAPSVIRGLRVNPDNPLRFDFIIENGDDNLQGEAFEQETMKLVKYFMTALTVPDEELWVNLSPYEKDRIIADGLGQTEMGRDLLAQDYLLKQFTASLMYPDESLGEQFWQDVYEKAQAQLGTTYIPTNTFNKVWIIPDRVKVYVNGTQAMVAESHLKVMLEEDYLAHEVNKIRDTHGIGGVTSNDVDQVSELAKETIREILLPEIEREVNYGKTFAPLRQIYYAMILSTWYKRNLRRSVLGQTYVGQNKTDGITSDELNAKERIYQQYLDAFEVGVFDLIKEEYDPVSQEITPKKYFSGGIKHDAAMVNEQIVTTEDMAMNATETLRNSNVAIAQIDLRPIIEGMQQTKPNWFGTERSRQAREDFIGVLRNLNSLKDIEREEAVQQIVGKTGFDPDLFEGATYDESLEQIWVEPSIYHEMYGDKSNGHNANGISIIPRGAKLLTILHERRHALSGDLNREIEGEINAYLGSLSELVQLAQEGYVEAIEETEALAKPLDEYEEKLASRYADDNIRRAILLEAHRTGQRLLDSRNKTYVKLRKSSYMTDLEIQRYISIITEMLLENLQAYEHNQILEKVGQWSAIQFISIYSKYLSRSYQDSRNDREIRIGKVVSEIVSDLRSDGITVTEKKGRFFVKEAVESNGGEIQLSSGGILRIEEGVLIIVDQRFKGLDHAGRGTFQLAVYASSEQKIRHELTELEMWLQFAVENGIMSEQELDNLRYTDIQMESLGQRMRRLMNEGEKDERFQWQKRIKDFYHLAHIEGLKAEGKFANAEEYQRLVSESPYEITEPYKDFDIFISSSGDQSIRGRGINQGEINQNPPVDPPDIHTPPKGTNDSGSGRKYVSESQFVNTQRVQNDINDFRSKVDQADDIESKLNLLIPEILVDGKLFGQEGFWIDITKGMGRHREHMNKYEAQLAWAMAWEARLQLFNLIHTNEIDDQEKRTRIEQALAIAQQIQDKNAFDDSYNDYLYEVEVIVQAYWEEAARRMSFNELRVISETMKMVGQADYTNISPMGEFPYDDRVEFFRKDTAKYGMGYDGAIVVLKIPSILHTHGYYGVGLPYRGVELLDDKYVDGLELAGVKKVVDGLKVFINRFQMFDLDAGEYLQVEETRALNQARVSFERNSITQETFDNINAALNLIKTTKERRVGGIDLNPNMMQFEQEGQPFNFNPPDLMNNLQNMNITGFNPVIINVTPITNIPLLFGSAQSPAEESQLLSYSNVNF